MLKIILHDRETKKIVTRFIYKGLQSFKQKAAESQTTDYQIIKNLH